MLAKVYPLKVSSENTEEVLVAYQKYLEATHSAGSIKTYTASIRSFFLWCEERNVSPLTCTAIDLVDFREDKKNELSVKTVNRLLTVVKVFNQWLAETKQIPTYQFNQVKLIPTAKQAQPKWLNRTEQSAFMRAVLNADNMRDELIIRLMLQAGLRVAEVASLTKECFSVSERKGDVRLFGKGGKFRTVPLCNDIRRPLLVWFENVKKILWPTKHGTAISSRAIRQMVEKYAYNAKLQNVSPHTLRHTFCKELVKKGVFLEVVAELAGHSNLETTRLYTVPGEEELQHAADRLNWE